MDEKSLVDVAQSFVSARGISSRQVSFLTAGDGKFLARLKAGRTCTLRVARVAVQYLSDHWPDDQEWPDGIPRPVPRSKSKRPAAA